MDCFCDTIPSVRLVNTFYKEVAMCNNQLNIAKGTYNNTSSSNPTRNKQVASTSFRHHHHIHH